MGQTKCLEAELSRKQASGVDLVRPLVSTSLRESSLARQEINGMDEENVQGKRGVEEDVDDIFGEEDLVERSDEHQEDLFEPDEVVVVDEASEEIPVEFAEEGRAAVGLRAPVRVSRAQVEEHELTHTPYRSWYSICVKARGQKMPHLKGKDEENEFGVKVPKISMDYLYMSKNNAKAKPNRLFVILNEETNQKYARATGQTGIGTEGVMECLVQDISEELKSRGHAGGPGGHIIFKSD